jgi:hypothetical protein
MAAEYHDAVDEARLDTAARRLTEASARAPGVPLRDLALAVVREMFCSCVAGETGASPRHPASIHVAVAAEIAARAGRAIAARHGAAGAPPWACTH